jgi:hypothetical protein
MLSFVNRSSFLTVVMLLGCATLTSAADTLIIRGTDMGRSSPSTTGDPGVILTRDTAQGEMTHIGRYTMTAQEFVNLKNLEITGGEFTITTANGDSLTGTYSGTGKLSNTPNVITYDVAGPITGGTGRFRNATGVILFLGTADLATNTFTDQVVGVVLGS